jgi:hypothetical protein
MGGVLDECRKKIAIPPDLRKRRACRERMRVRGSRTQGISHSLGWGSNERALYFGVTLVYVRVLVVEAIIIAALWALGHMFS